MTLQYIMYALIETFLWVIALDMFRRWILKTRSRLIALEVIKL